ncbi:hypothetical protein COCC4DRAFT_149812 [Bipolaris maydis ATCC 48331]|uniref:Tc3 transposase DNA binding domain-containing protein n=2 Tax=Cochliobolus heterostrophus TaxID=5016 RepID=M2ST07_COCH5|nr:uncharacterized protein COCC4DRAFT_149812 [Bipolaris maydis ATCC 48331]EMD88470.1 hypothetical protein COCHEDRAFT_1110216 [Bipolaris maydis C5]ENI00691.1 hypothetical protein COCC4DRAFT_149812 [Bipolaris maydis ATCC 48331]KAJ6205909.1 hypothetical protein PSV09DRAFT_1110216 [Bipolaris maydis]
MTLAERNVAVGMLQGGVTLLEVAAKFGRAASTIYRLYKEYNTTRSTDDMP